MSHEKDSKDQLNDILYKAKCECAYWVEKAIAFKETSKFALAHSQDKMEYIQEFRERHKEGEIIKSRYFPKVQSVAIFLLCFAIEAEIKGLIMLKDKKILDPGKFFKHNLWELSKMAGLSLSNYRTELDGGTETITWLGKYPIPKEANKFYWNTSSHLPRYKKLEEIYTIIFKEICNLDGSFSDIYQY